MQSKITILGKTENDLVAIDNANQHSKYYLKNRNVYAGAKDLFAGKICANRQSVPRTITIFGKLNYFIAQGDVQIMGELSTMFIVIGNEYHTIDNVTDCIYSHNGLIIGYSDTALTIVNRQDGNCKISQWEIRDLIGAFVDYESRICAITEDTNQDTTKKYNLTRYNLQMNKISELQFTISTTLTIGKIYYVGELNDRSRMANWPQSEMINVGIPEGYGVIFREKLRNAAHFIVDGRSAEFKCMKNINDGIKLFDSGQLLVVDCGNIAGYAAENMPENADNIANDFSAVFCSSYVDQWNYYAKYATMQYIAH